MKTQLPRGGSGQTAMTFAEEKNLKPPPEEC